MLKITNDGLTRSDTGCFTHDKCKFFWHPLLPYGYSYKASCAKQG